MNDSSEIRHVTFAAGGQQPAGVFSRLIALLIGCIAFIAAVLVGAVFLAGLFGMLVIGGTVIMLRVWWLRRQMDKVAEASRDLEGQYTVIREEGSQTYRSEDTPRS